MILDMLKKFSLQKEQFLKVGDTVADILEGKNAGVKTAAILSGK
ncbi:MAG: HAD family hydrolase [Chitinophagaceae bacterium]